MKNISVILAILIILGSSWSCSEEFLDHKPLGTTSENVFYNENGINALLTGVYGVVSGVAPGTNYGASIQNWVYGSVMSDDAYKGSEFTDAVPFNSLERWETLTDNIYVAEKWRATIGAGVTRSNMVLKILNDTEGIDGSTRSRLEGEARFLRALFNFEAWLVFENIPIITEDTEDPASVSNINPEGAVLQHIVNDLEFAWNNLPETQSEVGRPTRYAAMALAARAYMQELEYTKAKPLLDEIINSGKYTMMPRFMDNYRIATNNNAESIFEIQASVNDGSNGSMNGQMGIGLNFPYPGEISMCCGFHQPSQNLVNAFKVDAAGLPLFDTFNEVDLKNDQGLESTDVFVPFDDEVDPRLDWTVSRRGIPYRDWGINPGRRWIRDQPFGGPYLPASKPIFNRKEKGTLSTTTGWMAGVNANNYRYLRLTHILLWRAEIAAFEGDLELTRQYVNMIRERAGNEVVMGKVLINRFPSTTYPWGEGTSDSDYMTGGSVDWSQPAANYKIGLYPPFTNAAAAMRAVQWELRLEFATEGLRFFDLRRWDSHSNPDFRVDMAKTLNDFAVKDLRIRNTMQGAQFNPERDKYLPIPQNQINLQPDVLVQNPGY
ncbi:MAG TPA: RagB/SusD family nutrient uptake outer membrane protein [Cyclobacteriaceae bacterium]|nr:RagB/SusD family nutrient uptake outer membrane protein [Cyclobacteriaceae bacterium]